MKTIKDKTLKGQFCRNDEKDDNPNDWLYSALCFTGALSYFLKENEGIVVDCKNALLEINPDIKKVIVWCSEKQINITPTDEDLKEGQLVWME